MSGRHTDSVVASPPPPRGDGSRVSGCALRRLALLCLRRCCDGRDRRAEIPTAHRPHRRRGQSAAAPTTGARIEQDLTALEEKSTDQLVVYTTRSLQGYPIEDFGYRLGRDWQIGQKGKNNGVILIVAPNDRKVRIEVGRGLEPQLTDLMTKLIVENAILPAFRRNDFRRRHQGRRARHPRRAAGRRGGGQGARQDGRQALAGRRQHHARRHPRDLSSCSPS